MMAQDSTATEWRKWRRRVRVALIHALPLRGTAKVLMRAICDCLGEREAGATSPRDPAAWAWPSITWLADACGCSDRSVQKAKASLVAAGLIEIDARFERGSGRQQSDRVRICWPMVGRMAAAAPMCAWSRPDRLSDQPHGVRVSATRAPKVHPPGEPGSPSPRTEFTPPVNLARPKFTPGVNLVHPLNGIYRKETQLPAPLPPPTAPGVPDGRRRRLWMWLSPDGLRQAVTRREPVLIMRAFLEAVDAGAITDSDDARQAFFATWHDVTRCQSPVGVLVSRLNSGEISRANVSDAAWIWAGALSADPVPAGRSTSPCRICHGESRNGCEACNPELRSRAAYARGGSP